MDKVMIIKEHLNLGDDGKIIPLAGDASSRKYYRIQKGKSSLVACWGDPNEVTPTHQNFMELQKVLYQNQIPVPLLISSDLEKGILIQQDLGDQSLFHKGVKKEDLEMAIDYMIAIHSIDLNPYSKSSFATLSFDREKLSYELDLTTEYFLNQYMKIEDLGRWRNSFEEFLPALLDSSKMVLVHRDYHSKNIMVHQNKLYIIDFQDARLGYPQYDLCSLLEDCYVKYESKTKEEMIEYYYKESNQKEDFNTFKKNYDLMAIQRILKALGTFTMMKFLRRNEDYLQYIPYALTNLKEIVSRNPELIELNELVGELSLEA